MHVYDRWKRGTFPCNGDISPNRDLLGETKIYAAVRRISIIAGRHQFTIRVAAKLYIRRYRMPHNPDLIRVSARRRPQRFMQISIMHVASFSLITVFQSTTPCTQKK